MWGARLIRQTLTLGGDVLSFALPRHCPGCAELIETHHPLCAACMIRLENLRASPCCRYCASPIPDDAGPCGRCKDRGLKPYRAIARLTTFESTTRDLVHAIKYGRKWSIIPWLTAELVQQPRVAECLSASDVIVPVPLHWARRFGRGFNQAELIARELARHHPARVVNAVRRVEMTRSQTAFHSRQSRQANLRRAFKLIRPDLLEGKHVLIVDDVMTSGATLQTLARTIRRGCKPRSLRAIVIASANPLSTDLAI